MPSIRSGNRRWLDAAGFTLVELLTTVIIVGILASVAVPLYRQFTETSYASEAESGLGLIRRTMRAWLLQSLHDDWSGLVARYTPGIMLKPTDITELKLRPVDLDGRFFDHNAYRMTVLTNTTFVCRAIGDSSKAVQAIQVRNISRRIDQNGSITKP